MRGYQARLEHQHHQAAWTAWHIATLSRAKTIPDLSALTGKPRQQRRMTVEEIEFNLRQWAHATQQES